MADIIIMKTKKYNEDIYPGESIQFGVPKEDGSVFSDTSTFFVEIYNQANEKIDDKEITLSVDKLNFSVKYLNTLAFPSGKTYKLYGRLKDTATDYNNVVIDITLNIQ